MFTSSENSKRISETKAIERLKHTNGIKVGFDLCVPEESTRPSLSRYSSSDAGRSSADSLLQEIINLLTRTILAAISLWLTGDSQLRKKAKLKRRLLMPLMTNNASGATRATRRQSPSAFSSRVDRHGKPFGERLPLPPTRGRPISNKIIPRLEGRSPRDTEKRRHLIQEATKSTQERV
ncbi:unnamed protein product [Brassica oleracea]